MFNWTLWQQPILITLLLYGALLPWLSSDCLISAASSYSLCSWTTQEGLLDRLQPWNGICVMISFLHSNEALLFIWCFYFSSSVPARERKKGKKRYFIINNSNSFNLIQFHVFVRFMEMAIEHIWDGYWISRYVDVESSLNKRVIITWRWELQLACTFSSPLLFSLRSRESHLLADFSKVEAAAQRKKLVEVASHLVFYQHYDDYLINLKHIFHTKLNKHHRAREEENFPFFCSFLSRAVVCW